MKVNVYDFDHTVYAGDSSVEFYLFCVKKQPDILRFFAWAGFRSDSMFGPQVG